MTRTNTVRGDTSPEKAPTDSWRNQQANEKVVVIGAGPAGIQAALDAADLGADVVVVEKEDGIGGKPIHEKYAALAPDIVETEEVYGPIIDRFLNHDNIDLRDGSEVTRVKGKKGDFTVTVENGDDKDEVDAGSIVLATGVKHFDPQDETQFYGYHELDDVITIVDAEEMLKDERFVRPSDGQTPETVAFVQCVGSRDRQIGNTWCSKVCCGVASKQAIEIKEQNPDTDVVILYIDMRTTGFLEDQVYWKAQEEHNVQYVKGVSTEITRKGDNVLVKGDDSTMGRPYEIEADMAVLSVGMEPSEGTKQMADVLDLPMESHGFVKTEKGPMGSVETPKEGVFVAGGATGPSNLKDSVSMGGSAAAKAVAYVNRNQ